MKRKLAKLVQKSFEGFTYDVPPEGNPIKVTIEYSFDLKSPDGVLRPDLLGELVDAVVPKFPGRPVLPNTFEILDAAAQAKATKGKYRHVAFQFGKSPKHVTDLVHTHKPYFLRRVASLKKKS